LINNPQIVLADEPTGNLDREIGTSILDELRRITDNGVSVIAVTHDELSMSMPTGLSNSSTVSGNDQRVH